MKSFIYQKLLFNVTVFSVFRGLITVGLDYRTHASHTFQSSASYTDTPHKHNPELSNHVANEELNYHEPPGTTLS